jgi:hypothetical protein
MHTYILPFVLECSMLGAWVVFCAWGSWYSLTRAIAFCFCLQEIVYRFRGRRTHIDPNAQMENASCNHILTPRFWNNALGDIRTRDRAWSLVSSTLFIPVKLSSS